MRRVDGGSWQKGKHFPKFGVKGLAEGDHTITARAKNTDGCMDPTPVTISFTIDTTAPVTTLNGPVSPSNSKDVTVYGYVDDKSVSTDGTQYKLGADGIYSTPGVPTVPCAGCPDNTFAVQLTDLVEVIFSPLLRLVPVTGIFSLVLASSLFFSWLVCRSFSGYSGPGPFVRGCV